jgi:Flp pilus assembly protein TadD
LRQRDPAGAIADHNRAVELSPKNAHAYLVRSETRRSQGDVAGAESDLARARELNPKIQPRR